MSDETAKKALEEVVAEKVEPEPIEVIIKKEEKEFNPHESRDDDSYYTIKVTKEEIEEIEEEL